MMLRTLLGLSTAFAALAPLSSAADNQLTAAEKSTGWSLLFDGHSMDGWRPFLNRPAGGWEVRDGTLHAIAKVKGTDLVSVKKYNDFELTWEWKVPPAGNNGVKYLVTEERAKSPGHEYQMIDDAANPDAMKNGILRQTAAFYDVLPAAVDRPTKPAGEWNSSKIVVRGNTVEHWLNGRNVLTYELGSAAVKAGIAKSKFKNEAGFGQKIAGHLMLTYHEDDCWYRNIKIREIKAR